MNRHAIGIVVELGLVAIIGICLTLACGGCGPKYDESESLVEIKNWPVKFMEWGHSGNRLFAYSHSEAEGGENIHVWHWQDGNLHKITKPLPGNFFGNLTIAKGYYCGESVWASRGIWGFHQFDMATDKIVASWKPPWGHGYKLTGASQNGQYVVVLTDQDISTMPEDYDRYKEDYYKLGVLEVKTRKLKWVWSHRKGVDGSINNITITNDGRYVVIGGWRSGFAMIDTKQSKLMWEEEPISLSYDHTEFSPKGDVFYAAGFEGLIQEVSVQTGKLLRTFETNKSTSGFLSPGVRPRIADLTVSPDGKWLAVGTGYPGDVYVWNLKSGEKQFFHQTNGRLWVLAFSPDSTRLAAVGGGSIVIRKIAGNTEGLDKEDKTKDQKKDNEQAGNPATTDSSKKP